MKKHFQIGLLGIAPILFLAANSAVADNPRLGFVVTNAQNPAEVSMLTGFKKVAEAGGATVVVINAKGQVEGMTNGVQDLITQKVNGIATITLDSVVAASWVQAANAANIPYVSVALQVGDPKKTPFRNVYPGLSAFVGQDYILSGRRIARGAIERGIFAKGRETKVGIIEGQPGYALVGQLKEGFTAELKEAGVKFKIVMSQPTDWTPAKGQEVCSNAILANPDIDVFFSQAEDMAIGCAKAIQNTGSKAKLITVAGGSKLGGPLIRSGAIAVSMCEPWIRVGELGAKALLEADKDPSTKKARLIEYKPEIIDAKNIDQVCSPAQW